MTVMSDPAHNTMHSWGVPLRRVVVVDPVRCCECGITCKSRQALAAHAFKAHSKMPDVKRRVATDFCLFCLQHFGTVTRVYNHLYKSKRCKSLYLLSVPELCDDDFG
eukprot:6235437-Karenia_brevis.AAC.1